MSSREDHSTVTGNYKTDLTLTGLLMEGLVRRFNPMGDLEKILPDEIRSSTIATEHQIAILGFEAFEVRKDGLLIRAWCSLLNIRGHLCVAHSRI